MIVRARLLTIGRDYEEAAVDLGASPAGAVRRVLLKLLYPAIFASAVLVFADVIDDFILVRYLSGDSSTEPVSIKVYNTARAAPTPALNALTTLLLVTSLLAVTLGYLGYRWFTRGEKGGRRYRRVRRARPRLTEPPFSREGGEMPTIPPAPLDPAQLELSLAPFGSSRMLPRDAYLAEDVLAWEREHLFARLDVPGSLRRDQAGRAACASRSATTASCSPATRRACSAPSRTPAATAATSCCRAAASADARGDRLPLPRLVLPARRQPDRRARTSRRSTAFDTVDARPQAGARCRSGTAGSSSTGPARPSDFADAHRRARGRSSRRTTRSRWSPARPTSTTWRRTGRSSSRTTRSATTAR